MKNLINCSPLGDRLCCLPRRFPPTYEKYASGRSSSGRSSSTPRLSSKGLAVTEGRVVTNLIFLVLTTLLFLNPLLAGTDVDTYQSLYSEYKQDGFTDEELVSLHKVLVKIPEPNLQSVSFLYAIMSPYAPKAHTGKRFFTALSWYKDTLEGNRDGRFESHELTKIYEVEVFKYLNQLKQHAKDSDRIRTWKMIQKLALLYGEILTRDQKNQGAYYPYEPREMAQIDFNSDWNLKYTINTPEEFNRRVIAASYHRPVLVKFGLTYCIHCLLLENLGSVPAVAEKYSDSMDVYKLWWNPKNTAMKELNDLAHNEGVTSSPYFILYVDGQQVRAGYAFPDENGDGMEEFLGSDFTR